MIEFFFPTKDRNIQLKKCLDSLRSFYPSSNITIANCSKDYDTTSELLKNYNVNEIILNPDPGINNSFNILFQNLSSAYSIWLSDDIVLCRPLDEALSYMLDNDLDIVGIPFVDNIHFEDPGWPIDSFGCCEWSYGDSRVGHFCLCKTEILKKTYLSGSYIDYHLYLNFGQSAKYKYLKTHAFLKHDRFLDETRKNRI